jgi:ketosteroid isomerase-like protein
VDAEESRRFVLAFFAELASGNPACWDRVSEEASWSLIARAADYPYEPEYTKSSYRRLVEGSGAEFPTGLRFTITGTTAERDRVAVEAESYGYHRSGALYNNRYHLMVLLAEGKIRTVREYLDSGHAAEVLRNAASPGVRTRKP